MSTILFVEDETEIYPVVRSAFRKEIKAKECEFIFVENGLEALKAFERSQNSIDLLVTDLKMPILDGNALIQELEQKDIYLKTIIMSGYPDLAKQTQNLIVNHERLFSFISKPLTYYDDLKPLIKQVLASATSTPLPSLDQTEMKFQQLSKLVNELSLDKKARIIKKLIPYLNQDSILEINQLVKSYLPEIEIRNKQKELLEEKIAAGKLSLDIDLNSIEMLRIEVKSRANGDRYCYLRGKLDGKQLNIYLGSINLFSDRLDLISEQISSK
ncbi:MAG: response regulator [Prochloraceae cyanobacterium]|nr:response regulator [Prochloraceae cyanobacterium]